MKNGNPLENYQDFINSDEITLSPIKQARQIVQKSELIQEKLASLATGDEYIELACEHAADFFETVSDLWNENNDKQLDLSGLIDDLRDS